MAETLAAGSTLVLGGVRSGKSLHAERLVLGSGLKPVYLATGRALDEEMSERISIHQDRRSEDWQTVEEPLALVDALNHEARPGRCVLVDCVTLWITNLMMAEADVMKEADALRDFASQVESPVVFVSNETGFGILPENAMARRYADFAGMVNQQLAAVSKRVVLVAAGLPLELK